MHAYQHILFATDLDEDSSTIGARAVNLAQRYGARVSILHVVEIVPLDLINDGTSTQLLEIENALRERAEKKLAQLIQALGLSQPHCHIVSGPTKIEVIRFAEDNDVDLIVMGKHSRHGFSRLLGSTTNAVLHSAPCDVLAVKIE